MYGTSGIDRGKAQARGMAASSGVRMISTFAILANLSSTGRIGGGGDDDDDGDLVEAEVDLTRRWARDLIGLRVALANEWKRDSASDWPMARTTRDDLGTE